MEKIGLVLPGGGMRGVYTSGVVDFFLHKNVNFPYIIGVSAGACNGSAYLSRQQGLGKTLYTKYLHDKRYVNFKNVFKNNNSILGMDFIFDEIPNKLEPFDFDSFNKANEKFIITATDCDSGKAVYFNKDDSLDLLKAIRASSSLPFVSPMVEYLDMNLLDGALSDPIPIKKSQTDGNNKNIVVLTRKKQSNKKTRYIRRLAKRFYPDHPQIIDAIANFHDIYNDSLKYIYNQQKNGEVLVIAPSEPIKLNAISTNYANINKLYQLGYDDASNAYNSLLNYSNSN